MDNDLDANNSAASPNRWVLIRDVATFQVKLIFDGLRDLVLVPISLIAGLVSLLKGGSKPGSEFYDLLRVGRQSERWINLFGAAEHHFGPSSEDEKFAATDIDEMVSRIETFVVDEYQSGGVTAQAKRQLDRAAESLGKIARKYNGPN